MFPILQSYFSKTMKVVGIGRSRVVYLHPRLKKHVIKVPLNELGNMNNRHEYETWTRYPGAKCSSSNYYSYLTRKLTGLDLCILVMEKVEKVNFQLLTSDEKILYLCIDCGQVGRNHDGKIVAYDWGAY